MSGLASLLLSPLDMCALCMLQVLLIEFLALNVEKTKVFINFTTQTLINLLMATHVKSEVARSLVPMMPDETGFSRQSREQEKPLFHAKTLILFIKQSQRASVVVRFDDGCTILGIWYTHTYTQHEPPHRKCARNVRFGGINTFWWWWWWWR